MNHVYCELVKTNAPNTKLNNYDYSYPYLELPQEITDKLEYLCHKLIEYLITHIWWIT